MLKTIKLCNVRYRGALLSEQFEVEHAARFEGEAFCRVRVDVKVRLEHEDKEHNAFREVAEDSHLVISRQYKKFMAALKREERSCAHRIVNGVEIQNGIHPKHRRKVRKRNHKQRSRSYHRKQLVKRSLTPVCAKTATKLAAI